MTTLKIEAFTNLVKQTGRVAASLSSTQFFPVHVKRCATLDWLWDKEREEIYSTTSDDRRATIHPSIESVNIQESANV